MSTADLTIADFGGKFEAIQPYITPTALAYINRSERLKELVRAYQADDNAGEVVVNAAKPDAAWYSVPVVHNGETERGAITFGPNTINTFIKLIDTLSHELGHYVVENPGAVIANARNAAVAAVLGASDAEARMQAANDYGAACHLTEGYARLAAARIVDQMVANGGLSNSDGSWLFGEDKGYKEYKALEWAAAATTWTATEMDRAMTFSLGEWNKSNREKTSWQSPMGNSFAWPITSIQ